METPVKVFSVKEHVKYLLTAYGQCLLNLVFILWLHKIDMPCSQVAVVAAEGTSVVLMFSKKRRWLSYHSPFSSAEESPAFHWWHCVSVALFSWTAYVLLCPALWHCAAKQGSRKWKQFHVDQMQSGTCIWRDGAGVTVTVTAWGLLHEQSSVSVSNLRQPSSCDTFQRCLQEGDKLTLVTLASPWGEKSS